MKKNITLLLLLIMSMPMLVSCGSDDDPIQQDSLSSVEITYTYTVSAGMLEYFNITAEYYNANGERVGKRVTEPTTTITTTVTKFPAVLPLTFNVIRTDTPTPTETPVWSAGMSIVVGKKYMPSGNVVYASKSDATSYSPLPDKFVPWSEVFIKDMARGYELKVYADGKIEF